MSSSTIVQVALPTPLPRVFDYLALSPEAAVIGTRVRVPFGAQRLVGFITGLGASAPARTVLKSVLAHLDQEALLPQELWQSLHFAARYYHHSLGEVLASAVPTALKSGTALKLRGVPMFGLSCPAPLGEITDIRGTKQRALFEYLRQAERSDSELNQHLPGWRAACRALERKGLVQRWLASPLPVPKTAIQGPPLNGAQQAALDRINAVSGFSPFLLYGVTGSGKTEVYLQAAKATLARGLNVLVLVPEIGLTPQTLKRFAERLAVSQVVSHSQLSDTERAYGWQLARSGAARLVLGTRSAVFAPMQKLGLIIVDEEHDSSYKQLEGFRYHARDLALKRAQALDIPIILGSATPSFEMLKSVSEGRISCLRLETRAATQHLPEQAIVDLRTQSLDEGLAMRSIQAIRDTLLSGGQVLILRNRRGYAPQLSCHDCGHVESCRDCERPMTYHRGRGILQCHYCERTRKLPPHCPQCHSPALQALGIGTERVELALKRLFPEWPVYRVDRDSVSRKGEFEQALGRLADGKPAIMVGTQMLAKGHDLADIALVVVLGADGGLISQDFRAGERLAQLLIQVAGRAGRAARAGRVLIQSHQPEHPLLQAVISGDFDAVAALLMVERRHAELPPFAYAALLRADAVQLDALNHYLKAARKRLEENPFPGTVYGPLPAGIAKRAGRHRAQLVIMGQDRAALHRAIGPWISQLHAEKKPGNVHISLDIDPYDFS